MKIISVSRRTDIPAFYSTWFMNRLKAGFAEYKNPQFNKLHRVSLKPEDVSCFVFWSKNYEPFIPHLNTIKSMGFNSIFHFTITGLPKVFESNLIETDVAIKSIRKLSDLFSPRHINWRYDPIIISDRSDADFHLKNFEGLAKKLKGYVERCYFSFVDASYRKVRTNFNKFQKENGITITEPGNDLRENLSGKLADIAKSNGITMFTCCGDYLISEKIQKAHCVDGDLIERLFFKDGFKYKEKPSRKQCGCAESVDIGAYDTCPHGCIYCYANINKEKAIKIYEAHNVHSAWLGEMETGPQPKFFSSKGLLEELLKEETDQQPSKMEDKSMTTTEDAKSKKKDAKPKKRLTPEEVAKMIKDWNDKSISEWAKEFDVSYQSVSKMAEVIRKSDASLCPKKEAVKVKREDIAKEAIALYKKDKGKGKK